MDPTDSLPQRSTFHFLLLVLLPVLVMTIAETTAISHFLSAYTAAAVGFKTLLLALAGFSLLIAWWLMSVNRPNRSFRVGVALLASFLIVLSMAGYIVFTKVPIHVPSRTNDDRCGVGQDHRVCVGDKSAGGKRQRIVRRYGYAGARQIAAGNADVVSIGNGQEI